MSSPSLKPAENGFFYAVWSDGRRSKRKSMGTKDRSVAERRFAEWLLLDGHRGGPTEDSQTEVTVGDCWLVYRERHLLKNTVRPEDIEMIWRVSEPFFRDIPVARVNQTLIDEYVRLRTSGRLGRLARASTCRTEISYVMACLRFCSRRPQNLFSPALLEPVELPKAPPPRSRWLRTDEIQRLIDAAAHMRRGERLSRIERFIWIALETAARLQAVLDLTWDRVDFDRGVIYFHIPGAPVTSKKRATVPISKALRPVLLRAYDERTNDLVLDNKSDVWASMQRVVRASGVEPDNGRKRTGISPHTLRHTAATHMVRNGVSLYTVAKILGNSYQMVERVYTHWSPDEAENTVDQISGGMIRAAE